jgi:hypothetical protein
MGERQVDERTEVGGHSAKMMGLKGQYCAGPPALAFVIRKADIGCSPQQPSLKKRQTPTKDEN